MRITKQHALGLAALSVVAAMLCTTIAPLTALAQPPTATNNDTTVSNTEVAQALRNTDGVLGASDQTKATTDSDSAIKAATAGATVDIPKDASDGVTLAGMEGPAIIDIALPNAHAAKDAQQVAPGVVAYAGTNGSANAVQATEDGAVRMLTVIDNPHAPTAYDYNVTIPNGGRIELGPDGSAAVTDTTGQVLATVATPWAKDVNGTPIQTYFTTDGLTLTQHILHNVPGVVYPVTGDPAWLAVAAGIVGWAAARCATTVIGDLGLSGVRWALRNGDWSWNKKLEDSAWACAWGVVGGGVLRFAPGSVKSWAASQIHGLTRSILRWK